MTRTSLGNAGKTHTETTVPEIRLYALLLWWLLSLWLTGEGAGRPACRAFKYS